MNASVPNFATCSGEVRGTRSSADPVTMVSPIAVPARKPRRVPVPPRIALKKGGAAPLMVSRDARSATTLPR